MAKKRLQKIRAVAKEKRTETNDPDDLTIVPTSSSIIEGKLLARLDEEGVAAIVLPVEELPKLVAALDATPGSWGARFRADVQTLYDSLTN